MCHRLALIAFVITCGISTPAMAQDVNVLLGGRATESSTHAGYVSVTGTYGAEGAGGLTFRAEAENTKTQFAGSRTKQDMQRILAGYTFVTDSGTFTALAGPTHVKRSINGGPSTISEVGAYAGLEGYGYWGTRGYWAGITQYSSPDEAFYTRAFTTYLVSGNTSIGPDISYLDEPKAFRL